VIDLASRRVVGWAVADHLRAELVCDALRMAITHRQPPPGLIFHSDRGRPVRQRRVHRTARRASDHPVVVAAPAVWDNAVAESFLASLKLELIDRRGWATRSQVRHAVFDYIERFYNRQRLHSSLGYLTPVEYEVKIQPSHRRSRGIVRLSGERGQGQMYLRNVSPAGTRSRATRPKRSCALA
jgi:transposase InsO family protein